jgi:hypothetical protein
VQDQEHFFVLENSLLIYHALLVPLLPVHKKAVMVVRNNDEGCQQQQTVKVMPE